MMRRRFLHIATVASLLLCLAAALMWVQSYLSPLDTQWGTSPPALMWRVWSKQGGLIIQPTRWQFMTPPNTLTLETYRKMYSLPGVSILFTQAGVRVRLPQEAAPFIMNLPTQPIYSSVQVEISYLLLFLIFATLLVISVRRLRQLDRRARYATGLCPICAYNLTGNTSGVCPECGTPVSPKSEAVA